MTVDAAKKYLRRVRTYEPPPSEFDPFTADPRELARYGYPRRPDREKEPRLLELWQKAFAHPHKVVRAQPTIDETLLEWRAEGTFGTSGWGGVVVEPAWYGFSPPEPANVVYGEWMVAAIVGDPAHPTKPMGVATWVGLNGYLPGQLQVVQAGVAAAVNVGSPEARYAAWFEWFPAPPCPIDPATFPVNAGDRLSVLVCTPTADHGFASIQNKTTGLITNIGFPPPPGIVSDGASAEWIVEVMTGWSDELPDFGAIAFLNVTAGTKHHVLDLSKAATTEIGGDSGTELTSSTVWGPHSTLVFWKAFV